MRESNRTRSPPRVLANPISALKATRLTHGQRIGEWRLASSIRGSLPSPFPKSKVFQQGNADSWLHGFGSSLRRSVYPGMKSTPRNVGIGDFPHSDYQELACSPWF